MNKNHIIHLTSVHPRYDTRIFLKMCSSLAKEKEFKISLIVADGMKNEIKNNVNIYDVGKPKNRIERIFKITQNVYKKALELKGDLYHLHDPELLQIGIKLKKLGKRVIFDSHEDFPKEILDREYLNKFFLKLISKSLFLYEKYACKKFDAVIAATPTIRDKFLKINKNSIDINNYAILDELISDSDLDWSKKNNEVIYVGGISKIRSIREIIKSLKFLKDVKLILGGNFVEKDIEEEVKNYKEWQKVIYKGFVKRYEYSNLLKRAKVGLVLFYPYPNHIEALPNKMFEYMAAGIPIVASNFPLWKNIIEENKCGICVNPLSPNEIARAINYIINHPREAELMGKNGRNLVIKKYNWNREYYKLYNLYKGLLK
jgi:glycosyltransferase involved in cell wall biosynthesis